MQAISKARCALIGFVVLTSLNSFCIAQTTRPLPNVVLIFCDDMGYADMHCYGGKTATPNVDALAKQGVRFTNFHDAQPICTASRAALMTGCYSNRVGLLGALPPHARVGISPAELTMAEMFKRRSYATAIYGKWHLGDAPQFLPTHHGFDEYFGLPYSNDMWPHNPANSRWPDLPLIENEKVIALNPDQHMLTTWYTEHAVKFIERNHDRPFFLYVPHSMPHVPIHVSDKFAGKSGHGLYGDVVQEIDWSVGQITAALERFKLTDNTIVIFASDNGPWLLYGNHAGSAGPWREGKMTTFEGGTRVPYIMRWPGHITPGRECDELASTIDLLPTFAKLIGVEMPKDRVIDGLDIWPLMRGDAGAKSPHESFYWYRGRSLEAVQSGPWKLHFAHSYVHPNPPGHDGIRGKAEHLEIGLSLFDLEHDGGETTDVSAQHPEVVRRLEALAEAAREDLGDAAMHREGKNVREPGQAAWATTAASGPSGAAPAAAPAPSRSGGAKAVPPRP